MLFVFLTETDGIDSFFYCWKTNKTGSGSEATEGHFKTEKHFKTRTKI